MRSIKLWLIEGGKIINGDGSDSGILDKFGLEDLKK